ncbi:type 4a pilus biogenesis protein PilO [Peptococcaceae bacterium 1198_IL3148]
MKVTIDIINKVNNLTKREKIIISALVIVAVCTLYYKYILAPQINEITQLTKEIASQEELLATRLNQGWDNIPWLKERSQAVDVKIEAMYSQVPNIADEANLLLDLYKIAKDNGMLRDTISFSKIKQGEDKEYSTMEISLKVFGSNENIYEFISDVQNYSRMNRITQITFEPITPVASECALTIEYYILHQIESDPLDYPFMEGQYGKDKPYQIFNIYEKEAINFDGLEAGFDNFQQDTETVESGSPTETVSQHQFPRWLLPVPWWIRPSE